MTTTARCAQYQHHTLQSLRAGVRSDIRRFMTKSEANLSAPDDLVHRVSAFLTPQILAQSLYRLSHYLYVNGWVVVATGLARLNSYVHKINLPAHTCIGPGLHIPHPCGITFCGSAGEHLTLYSLATCGGDEHHADAPLDECPVLGDRVTAAAHEAIMGHARLGDDVKIGLFLHRLDFEVPSGVIVRSRATRPTVHPKPPEPEAFRRTTGAEA